MICDDQCEADAVVEKVDGEWWARVVSEIGNADSEPSREPNNA